MENSVESLSSDFSRRQFLVAAGLAGASASGPLAASGAAAASPGSSKAPLKLGLDLFSLRSQGWSALELLDYSAKLGVQVVHFSEPRFLGGLDDANLNRVKAHADSLGLELEVGFGSICPTSSRFKKEDGSAREQLLRMFHIARKLGSPFVRCYLGTFQDRQGEIPLERHIENTVGACRSVRSEALEMGVKIAIENHAGDMQAWQLKALIEEAGKDYVGALYDAGNAAWTLEDPLLALETLAPYLLTSGFRDSAVWEVPEGAAVQWVAMGEGNVEIDRVAKRFAELCPGKTFSLEIINTRTPRIFAYWQDEFWNYYRDVPAWVFAGFQKIARAGSPYEKAPKGPQGVDQDSPEYKQFWVEQERRDVEQAVTYSKEKLGIGNV